MSLTYGPQEYADLYTEYRHYPFFAERAQVLADVVGMLRTQPLLVAGCGWGFLMKELGAIGFTDVWGVDASEYAIENATRVLEDDSKLILRDVLEGIEPRFRTIVTEDLLSCAEDLSEAVEMRDSLRLSARTLVHFLTPGTPSPRRDPRVLWLPIDVWSEALAPDAVIYS